MFCQGCGKEISDDTKFCPACGRPTDGSAVQANPQQKSALTNPKSSTNKLLLIIGIAVIALLVVIILVLSIKGKNKTADSSSTDISAIEEDSESAKQEGSILKDYIGDWRKAGDVWGDAYADQYEVPMYMRIESEGISSFASGPEQDETGRAIGETVYFAVGTDKIKEYEEDGKTYYELRAELYGGNGQGLNDTGVRFYFDTDEDLLIGELFTAEDGRWQRRMKFKRIDSINEDRKSRNIPVDPELD